MRWIEVMPIGKHFNFEVWKDSSETVRHQRVVVGMAPTPESEQDRPIETPERVEVEV